MSPLPRRSRAFTVAMTAGALILGAVVTSSPAMAAAPRSAIPGTLPSWAHSTGDTAAPAVTAGVVNARIYLAAVDPAGLEALATAVSNPADAHYGEYLTPAEVRARYGPSSAQIAAIESWARSSGLTVTDVDSDMAGYVSVTGSVAAAGRAFGVTFGSFRAPDGQLYRAPEQAASAPSAIAAP